LFWLVDNRKKSIVLREKVLVEAQQRFEKYYNAELFGAIKRDNSFNDDNFTLLS